MSRAQYQTIGEGHDAPEARARATELIHLDRAYLAARSMRRDLAIVARAVAYVARGAGR